MPRSKPRYSNAQVIVEPEGDVPFSSTVREFCVDNKDDEGVCEAVRALKPGQRVALGGGACPVVTVSRPYDKCPSNCKNIDAGTCPRCFRATGIGCGHGALCVECTT